MKVKTLSSFVLPALLFLSIIFLQQKYLREQEIKVNTINTNEQIEEEKTRQSLALQRKLPSLGFNNLLSDWAYLNFIQYFGDEQAREKTGYSLIPDFFETVSSKDNKFVRAFLLLSTANSVYAGYPHKTVQFLDEILKSIPSDASSLIHYLWFYKGVDEMLFLGDLKAAKNSFFMAKKGAYQQKEDIVAQRAQEVINFLETNPDTKRAKMAGWFLVLNTARDNKTKKYALEQIQRLNTR